MNDRPNKRIKLSEDVSSYSIPDKYENFIFIAGKNEIHFNSHVDLETICRIKKLISEIIDDNLRYLVKYDENGKVPQGQENEKDFTITYIVNSPGGSVTEILNFVDYIGRLRNKFANLKFTSIITGLVASAGTTMCVIADNRKMTRFSWGMIHELSAGMSRANFTRIITHAEFCSGLHEQLVTIYQESRGISLDNKEEKEKLEKLLLRESWMSAEEYKLHGFVHEIIALPNKKSQTT